MPLFIISNRFQTNAKLTMRHLKPSSAFFPRNVLILISNIGNLIKWQLFKLKN